MFIMNKTNEYKYVPNQVNIWIRIRIRDIHFSSYPTTFESVSVSELKCGKKMLSRSIPCVSDSIPSLVDAAAGWGRGHGVAEAATPRMKDQYVSVLREHKFGPPKISCRHWTETLISKPLHIINGKHSPKFCPAIRVSPTTLVSW